MTTLEMNNLWSYINGMGLPLTDREWLANKLLEPAPKAKSSKLDMSLAGIKKHIRQLQTEGSLRRIGPDKGGHWEVVK